MSNRPTQFPLTKPRTPGRVVHFVASVAFIVGLAYILGHSLLDGPLPGDQSPIDLARADWLNSHFPAVPPWYPQQGGGSLASDQSTFAHLMVVATHRVSGLSLTQAFRLVSFVAFPLTALGIYAFAWSTSRKGTVALLGAALYLLAPLTWTWIYDQGRLPFGVATVFVPLALTCFDQLLSRQFRRSDSAGRRVWLMGTVLSLAVAALIDPSVGAAAAAAILVFALTRAVLSPRGTWGQTVLRTGWAALSPILTSWLLVTLFLLPRQQSPDPTTSGAPDPIPSAPPSIPPITELVGLSPVDSSDGPARLQIPLAVMLAFVGGTVASPFHSPKILALCLTATLGFAVLPLAESMNPVASQPVIGTLVGTQTWLLIMTLLIPVGAAFGMWAIAWVAIHPGAFLRRRSLRPVRQARPRLSLEGHLASGLALVFAGVSLLGMSTYSATDPNHVPYGPLPDGVNLGDIWQTRMVTAGLDPLQQLAVEHWPALVIRDEPLPEGDVRSQIETPAEEPTLVERLAGLVSIAGFGLLVILLLDGLIFQGQAYEKLRDFIRQSAPRPFLGDGPIHDWVERKQKEINGEEVPVPGWAWTPNPILRTAANATANEGTPSAFRGDGRKEPFEGAHQSATSSKGSTPDELNLPTESHGPAIDEVSPPDWLRRLDAEAGKGAAEILNRRRLRKT